MTADGLEERTIRAIMAIGLVAALSGLAIAAAFGRTVGGIVCVSGWVLLAYSVHKMGRIGGSRSPGP